MWRVYIFKFVQIYILPSSLPIVCTENISISFYINIAYNIPWAKTTKKSKNNQNKKLSYIQDYHIFNLVDKDWNSLTYLSIFMSTKTCKTQGFLMYIFVNLRVSIKDAFDHWLYDKWHLDLKVCLLLSLAAISVNHNFLSPF